MRLALALVLLMPGLASAKAPDAAPSNMTPPSEIGFRSDADETPAASGKASSEKSKRGQAPSLSSPAAPEDAAENMALLDGLIDQEGDAGKKAELQIEREGLRLQRARSPGVTDGERRKLREAAATELATLVRAAGLAEGKRAYGQYLLGLALIDLGREKEGEGFLEQSMRAPAAGHFAPGVAIYLGERYFAREEWAAALKVFGRDPSSFTSEQRDLAAYRSARCWLALGKVAQAEAKLQEIAAGKSAYRSEATLAWGAAASGAHPAREVVAISRTKIKARESIVDFLTGAFLERRKVAPNDPATEILDELMRYEGHVERRIRFRQMAMKAAKTQYASNGYWLAFEGVKREVEKLKPDELASVKNEIEPMLGPSLEAMIRIFTDTYAGRVEVPAKDAMAKPLLARRMEESFAFYERISPQSKLRGSLYALWLDVCADQKDYACVYDLAGRIRTDAALAALRPRAERERLAALDGLADGKKAGAKFRAELIASLESQTRNPKAAEWTKLARRLASLYMEDKRPEKAVPVLEGVCARDCTEPTFYSLQAARFEAGMFAAAAEAATPPSASSSARCAAIARESSLKVAQASESKDLPTFERAVDRFLQNNRDPAAAIVALRGLFNRYAAGKAWPRAADRLRALPEAQRRAPEIAAFERKTTLELMKTGEFARAVELTAGRGYESALARPDYGAALARLGAEQNVPWAELAKLKPSERESAYVIAALTLPRQMEAWAERSADASAKRATLLALQIDQAAEVPAMPANLRAKLASLLPDKKPTGPSKSERMGAAIVFRAPRSGSGASLAGLKSQMEQVRRARAQVALDLKAEPKAAHKRILHAAAETERAMAAAIGTVPAPKGLAGPQLAEYRQGLAGVAKEFTDQSAEFDRASQEIARSAAAAAKDEDESDAPDAQLARWPWPKGDARVALFRLLEAKQYAGALILLDLRRSAKELSDADYAGLRAGALLHRRNNRFMRRFAFAELKAANQEDWMAAWKRTKEASP